VRALSSVAAAQVRPRRSVLYMPGSNARAINKARTLPADAVVLDLEDAVAPEKKSEARGMVLEELRRRLSDPARPRDELDYLERLLKRY
jgi:hypothetical protein